MIKHYLSITFRNLLRNKFQSVLSIVGLAVAFFCFGFCAYFVHGFLTMDQYYDNHDRVLALTNADMIYGRIRYNAVKELRQQFPEVEATFRYYSEWLTCESSDGSPVILNTITCDTTLQAIYNPTLKAGSWEAAQKAQNSMVLCESTARKLYKSPELALGQQFKLSTHKLRGAEGELPVYIVRAVVEDLAYNSSMHKFSHLDGYILNDEERACIRLEDDEVDHRSTHTILLRKGTDVASFQNRLKNANIVSDIWKVVTPDGKKDAIHTLAAVQTFDLDNFAGSGLFVYVFMMSVISLPGVLILLSALSNFFHLLLSNIMMRRREYTLRRAQGAHTFDLWVMVGTQVVVTLMLVGFVHLLIVELCAPILTIQIGATDPIMIDKGAMLWQSVQHLGVLLLIGMLVAWLAVARIRKDSLQESLKTSTGRRPGRHIGRNILMGWQMVVGIFFLILLGAIILQIRTNDASMFPTLTNEEKEEIVRIPIFITADKDKTKPLDYSEIESYRNDLQSIPSIQYAWLRYESYLNNNCSDISVLKENGDTIHTQIINGISATDLKILNIKLLQGTMPTTFEEILVDQDFVDKFHLGTGDRLMLNTSHTNNYIGTWFHIPYLTITGVIDNFSKYSTSNTSRHGMGWGCIYTVADLEIFGEWCCRSYPGKGDEMKRDINAMLCHRYGTPQAQYPIMTLGEEIRRKECLERSFLNHFWLFAIIALVITVLGIYSAITTDTTASRKEMAIRKINGAKPRHIIARFCRLYVILLVFAALIVFPLTYILFDYIAQVGYRNAFHYDFWFYLCIFLLMALFVALTIGVQIWRISRINPAQVVKSE